MAKLLYGNKNFRLIPFKNEAELEKVVVENYEQIFGPNTFYFDLKKGIRHRKGDLLTIPDGYLLKFNDSPVMHIIENELSLHDPVDHIGVHFLKYNSALTEASKYPVKKFLLEYLNNNLQQKQKLENLMSSSPYKNISDLLDAVILDQDFQFTIVIDNKTEEMERVVQPYGPEIIVLQKFQNNNEIIYHVEGDLEQEELQVISGKTKSKFHMRRQPDVDTIVCPAQEDGFNEVFLKERRWFAIRINPVRIPKIKYLAMYEVKPVSAIRYIGKIKEIKPYKKTGKYEIILEDEPIKIRPIQLSKENPTLAPQAPKYTVKSLIDKATKLEDIFIV